MFFQEIDKTLLGDSTLKITLASKILSLYSEASSRILVDAPGDK